MKLCRLCKKIECDGIEYTTEDMWTLYGFNIGKKVVCKNSPNVIDFNGKLKYRLNDEHGEFYRFYDVFQRL